MTNAQLLMTWLPHTYTSEPHCLSRVSVSRRTFGPGNVNVHAWFGATAQLTKCIWSMAVAQHQFYHERKTSKVSPRCRVPSVKLQPDLPTPHSLHIILCPQIERLRAYF